jgi:hypothetical protein
MNIGYLLAGIGSYVFELGDYPRFRTHLNAVFSTRILLIALLAAFIALQRCDPVGEEEQVRTSSSLASAAAAAAALCIVVCDTRRRSSCTPSCLTTTIWSRTPMRHNAEPSKSALTTMLSIVNLSSRRTKWPS